MMTRLHPDDIQEIAERVVLLLARPLSAQPADLVDELEEFRIRRMAREDLAAITAKRSARRKAA